MQFLLINRNFILSDENKCDWASVAKLQAAVAVQPLQAQNPLVARVVQELTSQGIGKQRSPVKTGKDTFSSGRALSTFLHTLKYLPGAASFLEH